MIATKYNDSDVALELSYKGKIYISWIPKYELTDFIDGVEVIPIKTGDSLEDIIDLNVQDFDYVKSLNLINPLIISK